jgi:hypothetical protein
MRMFTVELSFRIMEHEARAARARGFDRTTTGSDHDRKLPVLLLGGIIENQNSDFVMQ